MSFTDAKTYLEIPSPVVNQNGYLGHANVVSAHSHDLLGAEYITDACADGERWNDLCYSADQTPCDNSAVPLPTGGYKQFGQPELVEGSPFAVYDGVECGLMPLAESLERAEQRLSFSQARQVDQHVMEILAATAGTDLGSLTIEQTISQFEDWAAQMYGSYGVISLSRGQAIQAQAKDLIESSPSGGLQTILGTQVIAVATATPGAATEDAFVSGRITIIQGPVHSHSVPGVNRPDGSCDPQRALAERMYVPLVECMVVKATITNPA